MGVKEKAGWLRHAGLRVVLGAAAVAIVTGICYRLQLNVATTGFLLLLVVVVQSLGSNFFGSAIVAVIATGCLDYFIVPPILEWQIGNPIDAVALTTFLVTALVITRAGIEGARRSSKRRTTAEKFGGSV
jgi:K+-sensing histidine kinase KdpD